MWQMYSQLCQRPTTFRERLNFLENRAKANRKDLPYSEGPSLYGRKDLPYSARAPGRKETGYLSFDMGKQAGGVVHVSMLLRSMSLFETAGDLPPSPTIY